jgi:hypothetical protein
MKYPRVTHFDPQATLSFDRLLAAIKANPELKNPIRLVMSDDGKTIIGVTVNVKRDQRPKG